MLATVSSDEKAALATAAGAVRAAAPDGADLIAEVSPAVNNELDVAVAASGPLDPALLAAAAQDVTAAVAAGALRAGAESGLPPHHYPLGEAAAAHDAVERGVVGKVLIDTA